MVDTTISAQQLHQARNAFDLAADSGVYCLSAEGEKLGAEILSGIKTFNNKALTAGTLKFDLIKTKELAKNGIITLADKILLERGIDAIAGVLGLDIERLGPARR